MHRADDKPTGPLRWSFRFNLATTDPAPAIFSGAISDVIESGSLAFHVENVDSTAQYYGMLFRRSTFAHIHNVVASGFEAGFDVRDANTSVEAQHSIFGANLVRQVAFAEDGSNTTDQKDEDADGFFDPSAKFVGAFRDANDHGATDSWVVWGDE